MIKALLVDDEERSSINLKKLIADVDPQINILGSITNIKEAELIIRRDAPNVLFLDVEMPGGSGFDLLSKIEDVEIYVIFVSAYDEYALKAFKTHAIHYLLKPIDIDDLEDAINHLKEQLELKNNNGNVSELINKMGDGLADIVKIPTINGYELIAREKVAYLKSVGAYSELVTIENKKYTVSKNLGQLEELFGRSVFFRVHKSYYVNLKHVSKYQRGRGGYLILNNDSTVPVAVRRKKELLVLLGGDSTFES